MLSEASEFVVEEFVVECLGISVVVYVTELRCSFVLKHALAAAPEHVVFVAVDNSPDLSLVYIGIDEAVFFLLTVVSFELLLRASLGLPVQMC